MEKVTLRSQFQQHALNRKKSHKFFENSLILALNE